MRIGFGKDRRLGGFTRLLPEVSLECWGKFEAHKEKVNTGKGYVNVGDDLFFQAMGCHLLNHQGSEGF